MARTKPKPQPKSKGKKPNAKRRAKPAKGSKAALLEFDETIVLADGRMAASLASEGTSAKPKEGLANQLAKKISEATGKKVTFMECVIYPNGTQAAARREAGLPPLKVGFVVEMSLEDLERADINSFTQQQFRAVCFAYCISTVGGKSGMLENFKKFLNFQEYPTGGDKSDVKVALHAAGGGGTVKEQENECDAKGGSRLFKLPRLKGEDGKHLIKMKGALIIFPETTDGDSTLALVGKGLRLKASHGNPIETVTLKAIQEMNYIKLEKCHEPGSYRRSIAFTHPLSSGKNLAGKYNMKLPPVGKKYLESMEGKLHFNPYLQVVENDPTEFVPKHERTSHLKKIPAATRSAETVSPTRVSDPKVVKARHQALSVGISAYVNETDEATSDPAAKRQKLLPIVPGSFVVLMPGVGEALSEDTLKGMTFLISGCFPEAGGGEGDAVGVEQVTTMINSFGGRVASRFSKKTNFLLVGRDAVASKMKDATKREVVVISLRRLQGLLLGHCTLAKLATYPALKAEAFTGTAYQAAGSPPPGAANAPAKPAEPEKKPVAKAPAIEVPPAVQPSAVAMPEEDTKMPAAEDAHAHEAQWNALAHQPVPSIAAPPAVLGEFWVEGKSAPPVKVWQGV